MSMFLAAPNKYLPLLPVDVKTSLWNGQSYELGLIGGGGTTGVADAAGGGGGVGGEGVVKINENKFEKQINFLSGQ